jgi:hypothetical protein
VKGFDTLSLFLFALRFFQINPAPLFSLLVYQKFQELKFYFLLMDNIRLIEPALRIHPNNLVLFSQYHYSNYTPSFSSHSLLNLKSNFNHNNLSVQAKRKMTKAIHYLLYTASEKTAFNNKTKSSFKFKVNMVTLTLSSEQVHSDQLLKSVCLNQLLIELKSHYSVRNYVWKCEYQQNGNLHFHILTDKFIPWQELQNRWNRIQNKLGYVDRISFTPKHKQPNSVDVHSLRKVSNIASYCTKYMVKDAKRNRYKTNRKNSPLGVSSHRYVIRLSSGVLPFLRKLANKGRVWGSSYDLSNLRGGSATLDSDLLSEIALLQADKSSNRINKDDFSLLYFDEKVLHSGRFPLLAGLLDCFIAEHFGSFQPSLIFNEYSPPT